MTTTLHRTTSTGVPPVRPLRTWLVPLVVGALGFVISASGSTIPSLWYDEAATVISTARSWPQLWAMVGNVDAVYYAMTKLLFDVVGYSPLSLRLPSALAVGLTAGLIIVLGRRLLRPRVGVIAALIFCILPRVTWAGTEGRSYALTALLAVVVTLAFVALVSCGVFLYLALVIAAHGVTVVWQFARREHRAASTMRRWMFSAGAAAIVAIPFAAEIISQSGQVAWIEPVGVQTIRQIVRGQWFYDDWMALLAWALVATGIVALVRTSRSRTLLMIALPAFVVPIVGLVVMSVVISPIYQPRYLTMSAPFIALAIAAGIDAIRLRWAPVVALAVLASLALPHIMAQRLPEAKESTAWSEVAEFIGQQRLDDEPGSTTAIVWGNLQKHPKASARVIAYAYPTAFEGTLDPTITVPAALTGQLWEQRRPIVESLDALDGADVTYFITSFARDQRLETTTALATAGWFVTDSWEFSGVQVLRFEPRADDDG